jgi:hypothetical protein
VATHAGEVRVSVGGEPDRDDSGLPPVDIEIPDDARDLDRDVQAYHRELRARRRRMRFGRLQGPLTRDGLVLPLLAGCLAMVLISGVLLTVFTAGQRGTPPVTPSQPAHTSISRARPASRPTGQPAGQLPDATVIMAGNAVPLRSLVPSVLALVPAGCGCRSALRQLTRQAAAARVTVYLVGTSGNMSQVGRLAARAGQPADQVAIDTHMALTTAYRPRGLTAVLVSADGAVGPVRRDLRPASKLTRQLRSLAGTAR